MKNLVFLRKSLTYSRSDIGKFFSLKMINFILLRFFPHFNIVVEVLDSEGSRELGVYHVVDHNVVNVSHLSLSLVVLLGQVEDVEGVRILLEDLSEMPFGCLVLSICCLHHYKIENKASLLMISGFGII